MSCCGGAGPCSCRVTAGPGITVTGSGSASDPFVVSGGGSSTPTVITVADTPSLDLTLTGTGTAADPYVISGVAAAVPPAVGCGLTVLPSGQIDLDLTAYATLVRRTCTDTADGGAATTPLDPACNTEGMPIYCDTNGVLRTMPEKFTETALAQLNENVGSVTVLPYTTSPIQIGATNPSDCYCMCGFVTFSFIPAISGAPGTVIAVNHEIDMGDGVFNPLTGFVMDNRGKTASSGANPRPSAPLQLCLDPGETKIIRYRVRFERTTGDNGGAVLITGVAREIRFVGTNV